MPTNLPHAWLLDARHMTSSWQFITDAGMWVTFLPTVPLVSRLIRCIHAEICGACSRASKDYPRLRRP